MTKVKGVPLLYTLMAVAVIFGVAIYGYTQLGGMKVSASDINAGTGTTGGQPSDGNINVYSTTPTATLTVRHWNLTGSFINATGYFMIGNTQSSISVVSGATGKYTISNLKNNVPIDKVSFGSDGTYYWKQKSVPVNDLSPYDNFDLVQVAKASTVTIYDTLNAVLTNQSASNLTIASGSTGSGYLRYEVTSADSGVRAPIICAQYATTDFDRIDMFAGASRATKLTELTSIPIRALPTATQSRAWTQCFDTGVSYVMAGGAKSGIEDAVYGYQDYGFTLKAAPGVDPAGDNVTFGIVDRDEYYKSAPNSLFFVNPEDQQTDLGATGATTAYLDTA